MFSLCMDLWTSYLNKLFTFVLRHKNWWQLWDLRIFRRFCTTHFCIRVLAFPDSSHFFSHFIIALEIQEINKFQWPDTGKHPFCITLSDQLTCKAARKTCEIWTTAHQSNRIDSVIKIKTHIVGHFPQSRLQDRCILIMQNNLQNYWKKERGKVHGKTLSLA